MHLGAGHQGGLPSPCIWKSITFTTNECLISGILHERFLTAAAESGKGSSEVAS